MATGWNSNISYITYSNNAQWYNTSNNVSKTMPEKKLKPKTQVELLHERVAATCRSGRERLAAA